MQRLTFTTFIDAAAEKVWKTMLESDTYKEWTLPFNAGGSSFIGSWEEGSEMRFLGPDPETGVEGGMLSRVKENRPYEFISLEHYGIIMNGKEMTEGEEVAKWTPAYENYTFESKDGGTQVTVEMDMEDEHAEMFKDMWPKALEELKRLCEKA